MFNKISSQVKLLIPIFSLIIVLLFLGNLITTSTTQKVESLKVLKEKIIFGNIVSDLLHTLQKERGLSIGFVSSTESAFHSALLKQRKKTDQHINLLYKFINSSPFISNGMTMQQHLKQIKSFREKIDSHKANTTEVIQDYSKINNFLLTTIANIAKESHIPEITQNILTYSNFLYFKEYAGLERAQGVILFSQKNFDLNSFLRFSNLMALQKHHIDIFLQTASPEIKSYYKTLTKIEVFHEVEMIEKKIIDRSFFRTKMDAQSWYNVTTSRLDYLDTIGKDIKSTTLEKIKITLKEENQLFLLILILLVLSVITFIIMVIAFSRLIRKEQQLRLVMDKYIISSITDTKGVITDASEAFCTISGYTKQELIGHPHNMVRHPDMPKKAFKSLWKNLKQGKAWSGKIKNLKKDGGYYWVYANIEPLFNRKGEIESYLAIRVNITKNELLNLELEKKTEQYKIQKELMQQQQRLAQMGEMISMIAHQWRQPLSAITAVAASLNLNAQLDMLDNDSVITSSDKIKDFSLHLSNTIDDFRNFFKPNKEKIETNYKKILDSVLLLIENSLSNLQIELLLDIRNVENFNSYESELKQVLLNLIKNAEDALVDNAISSPKIFITIDKATLSVNDNAGGIPEEIMDKIFDPYFSTKLKKDGTGLGLYMSKLIIEDHCGGILSVENNERGAKFTIDLLIKEEEKEV